MFEHLEYAQNYLKSRIERVIMAPELKRRRFAQKGQLLGRRDGRDGRKACAGPERIILVGC